MFRKSAHRSLMMDYHFIMKENLLYEQSNFNCTGQKYRLELLKMDEAIMLAVAESIYDKYTHRHWDPWLENLNL